MQNTNSNSLGQELSKKDAESVAMSINLLLGNVKMFGSKHPSTGHAADELCQKITKFTDNLTAITLKKSGNSFYIEKYLVDKQINQARLAKEFETLRIDSISFMSNTLPWNLTAFALFYSEALNTGDNANKIMAQMEKNGQKGIALNNADDDVKTTVVKPAEPKSEPEPEQKTKKAQEKIVQKEEEKNHNNHYPLLSHKATVYFIKRYIEEFFRHKNPFSILVISDKVQSKDSISSLSDSISDIIAKGFRFLDISGFIHIRGKDIAIIILPMTKSDGLKAVLARLNKKIDENQQTLTHITIEDNGEKDAKALSYANIMKQILREHV
ncbi:MAG: hypothetical protein FWE23_04015 [Chitinivibrionia bacterium]|nr:hypothetical protein [Chitinivibrionia bacterium]